MRVIQLCKSVYPYSVGGVEVYVHDLARQLEKRGHEVHVIVTKDNLGKHRFDEMSSGTNVRVILRILNDRQYDCLHIHSFASLGVLELGLVLLFNRLRKKKPVVITPHGSFNSVLYDYYGKSIRFMLQRAYVFYLRKLSALVHCFVVFTQHQKEVWTGLGFPSEKVAVLPPLTDLDEGEAERLSARYHTKSVLYVGRLSKEKGIAFLLGAMPKVISIFPDAKLHVVGDGQIREDLVGLTSRLDIRDEVIFHGNVPHERLAEIYRASDVFVLPSICAEAFPLALFEAMRHGLPVVATNLGGQAEIVNESLSGELVNPGDPENLAEKISLLLSDQKLATALGTNAMNYAKVIGSKENIRKLEGIYKGT